MDNLRLRRALATGVAIACASLGMVVPTHAADTLDQSTLPSSCGYAGTSVSNGSGGAQIFTAGLSGPLAKVDLGLYISNGSVTNLTIEIQGISGTIQSAVPNGVSLASQAVDVATVSSTAGSVLTVEFASPATVTAGEPYSLVATTTDEYDSMSFPPTGGDYYWCTTNSGPYDDGNKAFGSWTWGSGDFMFATYVNVGGDDANSSAASSPSPAAVELSLLPDDGTTCAKTSESGSAGTWISLPGANDCSPPVSMPGGTLLGWATNPNFPVEIAQRQFDNGWGAYETFNADGQLTGVFIPAGGATFLSGAGNLYPIWSQ